MESRPARRAGLVIQRVVLLAVTAFALSIALGAAGPTPTFAPTAVPTATPMPMPTSTSTPMPTATAVPTATPQPTVAPTLVPTPAPASKLPGTVPGASRDEGVFLVTSADDSANSQVAYFIAASTRHAIQWADVQTELQLNPLWPVRWANRDEVLAFAEGAPLGSARAGLLDAPAVAAAPPAPVPAAPVADAPVTAAPAPQPPVNAEASQPLTLEAPATAQPTTAQPATYVLAAGDNLTHIAARFGTTIDAILAANGIANPNRIFVGQTLTIPAAAGAPDVVETPAAPAPTASEPATPVAETPDETAADEPTIVTYTVKPGDSAFQIARQFGVDQTALLQANGIVNANRIYAGQTLTIPSL